MVGNPYWTADNPNGWTGDELAALEPETQKEILTAWFHVNFEDPAESTPHDSSEGGYQYVWGGPYDAEEELFGEFGSYGVPEEVINEVVEELTRDGLVDWAPTHHRLASQSDGGTPEPWYPLRLGNPIVAHPLNEPEAREQLLERLESLERSLRALEENPPVVGSNRAPWTIEIAPFAPEDYVGVEQVIASVRRQAESSNPDESSLEDDITRMKRLAVHLGQWIKERLDKGADAFAKVMGAALAAALLGYYEEMVEVCEAALNWVSTLF